MTDKITQYLDELKNRTEQAYESGYFYTNYRDAKYLEQALRVAISALEQYSGEGELKTGADVALTKIQAILCQPEKTRGER